MSKDEEMVEVPKCGHNTVLLEIPLEIYERMIEDLVTLDCLRAGGVDNWDDFEDSIEDYEEEITKHITDQIESYMVNKEEIENE